MPAVPLVAASSLPPVHSRPPTIRQIWEARLEDLPNTVSRILGRAQQEGLRPPIPVPQPTQPPPELHTQVPALQAMLLSCFGGVPYPREENVEARKIRFMFRRLDEIESRVPYIGRANALCVLLFLLHDCIHSVEELTSILDLETEEERAAEESISQAGSQSSR